MQADYVERVIFAFKHYHPRFRPVVATFIENVFLHASRHLDIQKLINWSMCEHDLLKEAAMKALANLSDNKEARLETINKF